MKSWFPEDELRPFIIQLFKSIRHLCVISTVGNCNGWLNKKSVSEKFDVITNAVRIENLKTSFNFFAFVVYKILQSRHYIKFGI